MQIRPRSTPVSRMRLGDHLCLPYGDGQEQRAIIRDYFREGLRAGDLLSYIGDAPDRQEALRRLTGLGLDLRVALVTGQLRVWTAKDVYIGNGTFSATRLVEMMRQHASEAGAAGYRGLRVASEMSWASRALSDAATLIDYELVADMTIRDIPMMAICQYDRRLFQADTITQLGPAHGGWACVNPIHEDAQLTIIPTFAPRGIRLEGEIDSGNVDAIAPALQLTMDQLGSADDFHVNLSRLHFVDIAGIRALIRVAQRLPEGRRMVLHSPTPIFRKVLSLAGWGNISCVVLTDDDPVGAVS